MLAHSCRTRARSPGGRFWVNFGDSLVSSCLSIFLYMHTCIDSMYICITCSVAVSAHPSVRFLRPVARVMALHTAWTQAPLGKLPPKEQAKLWALREVLRKQGEDPAQYSYPLARRYIARIYFPFLEIFSQTYVSFPC